MRRSHQSSASGVRRSHARQIITLVALLGALPAPALAGRHVPRPELHRLLKHGRISRVYPNTRAGSNASKVVEIEFGSAKLKALFKPRAGEVWLRENIAPGTYYKRESAAAAIADALGIGHLVAGVVLRRIEGQDGALLGWMDDEPVTEPNKRRIDRESAEQLRAFDYVIGNSDRHAENLLGQVLGGRFIPIGIDHGLTLPNGPLTEFRWPVDWVDPVPTPLMESTVAFIQSIDPARVAAILVGEGIERVAARHALRRLARLKRSPQVIAVGLHGAEAMVQRVSELGRVADQGLTTREINAIEQVLDHAYR